MQVFKGWFQVKNVSTTVTYTLHMRPDICDNFYAMIKYYLKMQFDSYKLWKFSCSLLGGKIYFVFTELQV